MPGQAFRGVRALRTAFALALWATLLAGPALALDPAKSILQYGLDVWSARDGLPNGTINAIWRAKDGHLWLGTDGGLVRFDGAEFELFSSDNTEAFNNNEVVALAEDGEGALWVGLRGGGTLRFSSGRFERLSAAQGFAQASTLTFSSDPTGRLWMGTSEGRVARIEEGRAVDQTASLGIEPSASDSTHALSVDPVTGTLWVAHSRGIFAVSDGRGRLFTRRDGLSTDLASCVRATRKGEVLIGTRGGGLNLRTAKGFRALTTRDGLPSDSVLAILDDRDGSVWVGTTAGLARLASGRVSAISTRQGLPHDGISALFEDVDGSLWIGTQGGGLARLKDGAFTSYTSREGLADDSVNAVLEGRDGSLWVATDGGLSRLRGGQATTIGRADGLPDARVLALWEDAEGGLWVGTEAGLALVQGDRVVKHPAITALAAAEPGRLWARGVRVHQGRLWVGGAEVRHVALGGGPVSVVRRRDGSAIAFTSFLEDSTGALWIGSWNGLLSLEAGESAVAHELYRTRDGGSQGVVFGGLGDREGSLWIATRDRGLFRRRGGRWSSYGAAQGMPANDVYGVLEDGQGHLWMSTGRGIARVAKRDLDDVDRKAMPRAQFIVFSAADGLKTAESRFYGQPAAWKGSDGRLWFCTKRGVAVVDPQRAGRPLPPTPVVIKEALSAAHRYAGGPEISLPPGETDIEIRYAGLDLLAPEKTRFRYILDGWDSNWVEAGARRTARYARLSPGRYSFRVIASDAHGVFSHKGASLTLRLQPRLHERLWVRALMALALLGATAVAVGWRQRRRLRQLEARKRELASTVAERTAALEREVEKHERTEKRLAGENEHRRRLEAEAQGAAERLARNNTALVEKTQALEQEIRERRRAEEDAARERDLVHTLIDSIPDLISFKDAEGRYLRVNHALADLAGLTHPREARGRTEAELLPGDVDDRARAEEQELLATGRALLGQLAHQPRTGRWYLTTKVPIRDALNRVVGLVTIARDVTERRLSDERFERELEALLEAVHAVSAGDLTRRAAEGDDTLGRIGRSMNTMLDSFVSILTDVKDAAWSVATTSEQVVDAGGEISKGARYGRDEVQSTFAAVEEMAASMTQVSRNAVDSAAAAQAVLQHVGEGSRSVGETSAGMAKIDDAVALTAGRMLHLEQRSQEVSAIVRLIKDLATRSNLLSLNAAIEAAHAGDAGFGFTIVADEVRRLADRSSEATAKVTAIVERIVEDTRAALDALRNAMGEVVSGRDLSERARRSLERIGSLAEESAQLAAAISDASREQVRTTTAVSHTMRTIANVTELSAASADEATAAVSRLVSLADGLNRTISRFRLAEEASKSDRRAP